jgi:hypothetical protein
MDSWPSQVPVPTVAAAAEFAAAQHGSNAGLAVLDRFGSKVDQSELGRLRAGLLARHGRREEAEQLLRQRTADNSPEHGPISPVLSQRQPLDEAASAARSGLEVATRDSLMRNRLMRLDAMVKLQTDQDTEGAKRRSATCSTPRMFRRISAKLPQHYRRTIRTEPAEAPRQLEQVTSKYPASFDAWQELVSTYRKADRLEDAGRRSARRRPAMPGSAPAANLQPGRSRRQAASMRPAPWRHSGESSPCPMQKRSSSCRPD